MTLAAFLALIKKRKPSAPVISCSNCHRLNPPYAKTKTGEYLCRDCVKMIFDE